MSDTECTCAPVKLNDGSDQQVGTNWSPDCPEHGVGTEWYKTTGKAKFDVLAQRLKALNQQAREARRKAEAEKPKPTGDSYRDTY